MLEKIKLYLKKRKFKYLGKHVHLPKSVMFSNPQNIILADDTHVGTENRIVGNGYFTLSEGTMIGPYFLAYTTYRDYSYPDFVEYDQEIFVGKNVWIGGNVTITKGISIGDGAIIGAGSVLTEDVPPLAIMGGNPAKVVKLRDKEIYERLVNENKIYLIEKRLRNA